MFNKKNKEKDTKSITSNTVDNTASDEFSDFFDEVSDSNNQNIGVETNQVNSANMKSTTVGISSDNTEEKKDMVLYVIIDKPIHGMLNYFRESGLKVSNLFNNITEAKNAILMQSEPSRVVVIDTGLGKFTTTSMRAELIDMLGISDEHSKTTVFYTDSVLKVDTNRALGKLGKSIDWIQYKSTSIAVATILSYKENYKYDMEDENDEIVSDEEILKFKGLTTKIQEQPRMSISGFSTEALIAHLTDEETEELPRYEVNL